MTRDQDVTQETRINTAKKSNPDGSAHCHIFGQTFSRKKIIIFCAITFVVIVASSVGAVWAAKTSKKQESPKSEYLLAQLRQQEKLLQFPNQNSVLLIGNVDSGKDLFFEFISTNRSTAINSIKKTTIKDYMPQLFSMDNTRANYFNFPGFSLAKDIEKDISINYWIKRVADQSKSIKFVLFIEYPSITKSTDQSVLTLTKRLGHVFKDLTKFHDSILLIATNVPHNITLHHAKINVAYRLKLSKEVLETFGDNPVLKRRTEILDILLYQDKEGYNPKIVCFPASLNDEQKTNLQKFFTENLTFAEHGSEDIEFTPTGILNLKAGNEADVTHQIEKYSQKLKSIYEKKITEIELLLQLITNNPNQKSTPNQTELLNEFATLSENLPSFQLLASRIKSSKETNELSKAFQENAGLLQMDFHLDSASNSIIRSEMLQLEWASQIEATAEALTLMVHYMKNKAADVYKQDLDTWNLKMASYDERLRSAWSALEYVTADTNLLYNMFAANYESLKMAVDSSPEECVAEVFSIMRQLDEEHLNLADGMEDYLLYTARFHTIKEIIGGKNPFGCNKFSKSLRYLEDNLAGYSFLENLLQKLSSYEVQVNRPRCEKFVGAALKRTSQAVDVDFTDSIALCLNDTNFLREYNELQMNQIKWDMLGKIVDAALVQGTEYVCKDNNTLEVKGNYVFISQIMAMKCFPTPNLNVIILSKRKMFFDKPFQRGSRNFTVVSPTWYIHNYLNGTSVPSVEITGAGFFFGVSMGPIQVEGAVAKNFGTKSIMEAKLELETSVTWNMNGDHYGGLDSMSNELVVLDKTEGHYVNHDTGVAICPFAWEYNCLKYKQLVTGSPVLHKHSHNGCGLTRQIKNSQIVSSIIQYKSYLRESLGVLSTSSVTEVLSKLESPVMTELLLESPSTFFEEFYSLEDQYNSPLKDTLLPYYEFLLTRLNKFLINGGTNEAVGYLRLAIKTRIMHYKSGFESFMVVDLKQYLPLVKTHIEEYKSNLNELEAVVSREVIFEQFQKDIEKEIAESENFVTTIMPEIKKIMEDIDTQINRVLDEIKEKLKEAKISKAEAVKYKEDLARFATIKKACWVANLFGGCLSVLGPIGALVGEGIKTAADIVQDRSKPKKPETIQHLKNVENVVGNVFGNVVGNLENERNEMVAHLQTALNTVDKHVGAIEDKSISEFTTQMKNITNKISSFNVVKNSKAYKKYITQIKSKTDAFMKTAKGKTGLKVANVMKSAISHVASFTTMLGDIQKDNDEADANIAMANRNIDNLEKYEDIIRNILLPLKENLELEMENIVNQSRGISHSALDVQNWRIDIAFSDFKRDVENMVQVDNTNIKTHLMACLDKIQSGMNTAMRLFDRIQDSKDRNNMAAFIKDLTKAPALNKEIALLELHTKSNLIQLEYQKAMTSYKQYIFPFITTSMYEKEIPQKIMQSMNISQMISYTGKRLQTIDETLTIENAVITQQDIYLFPNAQFKHKSFESSSPPFYTWTSESYSSEITRLIEGKEVALRANIRHSLIGQYAVKFKLIGIQLILRNETLQTLLDAVLNQYNIIMTHLGNSYYNCQEKHYVIYHKKITMIHSVNKKHDRYSNLDTNCEILERNPALFSPYGTWLFQLSGRSGSAGNGSDLAQFAHEKVDLVMEGVGQYIQGNMATACPSNLDAFYERVFVN